MLPNGMRRAWLWPRPLFCCGKLPHPNVAKGVTLGWGTLVVPGVVGHVEGRWKSGMKVKRGDVAGGKRVKNYQTGWRKRRGELAESAFLHKAVGLGLGVAKPWGESDRYDFILDSGTRLWRVQIKSAHSRAKAGYRIHCSGRSGVPYTAEEIDVIVAYLVPEQAWYVIPVEAIDCTDIGLTPGSHRRTSRFAKYLEGWCWLTCKNGKTAVEEQCGGGGACPMR